MKMLYLFFCYSYGVGCDSSSSSGGILGQSYIVPPLWPKSFCRGLFSVGHTTSPGRTLGAMLTTRLNHLIWLISFRRSNLILSVPTHSTWPLLRPLPFGSAPSFPLQAKPKFTTLPPHEQSACCFPAPCFPRLWIRPLDTWTPPVRSI